MKLSLKYLLLFMLMIPAFMACNEAKETQSKFQLNGMPEGITIGKLDNGLTYYIVPEGEPGKVRLKMISKTGALSERPEQHGFAHMLEHTVFNGSENYPGNSSVNEMENMGMRPAHDYNAYTSNRHTEYFMTIPENNFGYLNKSLLILKDWMFHLNIDADVHETEKKIIIEEINRGGTLASSYLNGTSMQDHDVLGNKEEINSVSVKQLNAFYKDNYTPEQLALIVYGRMDKKKAINQIEKVFGNVSHSSDKVNKHIDVNHQTIVSGINKAIGLRKNTVLVIAYKTKSFAKNDYRSLKQSLVNNILCRMLKRRLKDADPSLGRSTSNIGSIIPGNMMYNFRIQSYDEMQYTKMLERFCQVMTQAQQCGFTTEEIAYYADELLRWYKKKQDNEFISIGLVQAHFLDGDIPLTGKERYKLSTEILPTLTVEDFSETLDQMLSFPKTILYNGNSKACTPDFNEHYILGKLDNMHTINTHAYKFERTIEKEQQPLISNVKIEKRTAGVVKKKVQLAENLDFLHYENGTDVILHQSTREKTIIKLLGKDGLNIVSEGDREYYKTMGGSLFNTYGTYTTKEAYNLERSLGITKIVKPLNYGYEYSLSSTPEHFEQMLQLFNLMQTKAICLENNEIIRKVELFAKRKQANNNYKDFVQQKSIKWLAASSDSVAMESLASRLYEYNKVLSSNFQNSIIYISGKLPPNAEELVSHYIASVKPSILPKKQIAANQLIIPQKVEEEEFERTSDYAKVEYLFTGLPDHNLKLKDELMLEAIGQYALIKMIETIRDKYGLVYALGMTADTQTYPADFYSLSLRYLIDQVNINKSRKIMMEEVLSPLSEGLMSEQDVEKVKAMMRSLFVMSFYDDKQVEDKWLRWKLKYDKVLSPDAVNEQINAITCKDIRTLMENVVDIKKHFVLIQRPKHADTEEE